MSGIEVSSRPGAHVAQRIGELRLTGEDPQRRPQQRRRFARQRLRREIPGERGDERSERVQALADQSLGKLRRGDGLAHPASLEEPARRQGGASRRNSSSRGQRFQADQRCLRFGRPDFRELAPQLVLRLIGSAGSERRSRSVRNLERAAPPPWRCRSVPSPPRRAYRRLRGAGGAAAGSKARRDQPALALARRRTGARGASSARRPRREHNAAAAAPPTSGPSTATS